MRFSIPWILLFVLSQIIKGQESLLVLSTCVEDSEKATVKFYKVYYDICEYEVLGLLL